MHPQAEVAKYLEDSETQADKQRLHSSRLCRLQCASYSDSTFRPIIAASEANRAKYEHVMVTVPWPRTRRIGAVLFGAGTSVNTQHWAQPVTAGMHGVSSKKCQLEAVE